MKVKILFGLFVILIFILNSAYAVHYVSGSSSVDAGEIRWGGTTKYNTQWLGAIAMWNNYGTGRVLIDTDTVLTIQDLTISDVNLSDVSWGARYLNLPRDDSIEVNTYFLDGKSILGKFSSSQKQHTLGHELGHALGLNHHTIPLNVMRTDGKFNYTTLGTQDKYDFDFIYLFK